MGIKLAEIEEGEPIILHIANSDNSLEMYGTIKKQLKDNFALITVDYNSDKKLNFDNVQVDLEYCQDNDVPVVWHNVKIASYETDYIIRTFSDGIRHNRRNSFRVAVATTAHLRVVGRGSQYITVRDISLSGFSIADRKMELGLALGDKLSVSFEDFGHKIDLDGRVVRIEEREDMIIYGMEICNLCKDLSSYISVKQRRNRNK